VSKINRTCMAAAASLLAFAVSQPAIAAWEPTKPVEIIVPAGAGGASDQMARVIQGIVAKHNLMKQPIIIT
jgi:putative tricarboxylic transport membrane protein